MPVPDKKEAKQSYLEGKELKKQGKIDEAIESFQESVRLVPGFSRPHLKLGNIYKSQKNWEVAAQCYQRVIGLEPTNAEAYLGLAKTQKKLNQTNGAIASYLKAMELKEDWEAKTYKEIGDTLSGSADTLDEAIAAYEKAAALQSEWTEKFYYKFARSLHKKERWDEAIGYYRQALGLNPDSGSVYASLGDAQRNQGDLDGAIESYKKVVELKPDEFGGYKALGNALKKKGQSDLAIKCYQKAMELKPEATNLNRALGDILLEQGRTTEAVECYKKVIS